MINKDILKQIRKAPELAAVEIITNESNRLEITFKEGTARTGKELLTVQDILFKNNIFSFIKSEKVSLFDNCIKRISISFY